MSSRAQQLSHAISVLDRRIDKLDAKVEIMHGSKKCGKVFWCGGYCDKVKKLVKLKKEKTAELSHVLALMAAERLAKRGLNDDVLKIIVDLCVL